ncbi:TPA: hypothetical protein EYP66_13940 [Candidatus Poribacteria bacterium]|nr:hypothetical protein [Candidatus Poribacteria bacterium]
MKKPVIMPNGKPFEFWDDTTEYTRVYHVACEHPDASDEGSGTEAQPFKTINRAAKILKPGEKVIVHGGVYRECVRPARGGSEAGNMIAYEAASGEDVIISLMAICSMSAMIQLRFALSIPNHHRF